MGKRKHPRLGQHRDDVAKCYYSLIPFFIYIRMWVMVAERDGSSVRVIAGENKGRNLTAVGGRMTRPTTDKVKESIFNMIGPFFAGGSVLDLYGGSGGLGIEALSRGAQRAVFVDRAAAACRVIKENIEKCGYAARCSLLKLDSTVALAKLADRRCRFDYVFLDPPYARQHLIDDIRMLLEKQLLMPRAMIVAEHDETVRLPESFAEGLERRKYRTYQGRTAVTIYCNRPEHGGREFV